MNVVSGNVVGGVNCVVAIGKDDSKIAFESGGMFLDFMPTVVDGETVLRFTAGGGGAPIKNSAVLRNKSIMHELLLKDGYSNT